MGQGISPIHSPEREYGSLPGWTVPMASNIVDGV